jgi:hypothetical protein
MFRMSIRVAALIAFVAQATKTCVLAIANTIAHKLHGYRSGSVRIRVTRALSQC